MLNDEQLDIAIAAHTHLHRWFQVLLGQKPYGENMAWLIDETSLETLRLFVDEGNALEAEAFESLECCLKRYASDPDKMLETMKDQYTRIFVGPGKLPLFHWESVYLKRDAILFQESTLEVRRSYLVEGFLPQGHPNVADDHVAIELDFIVALGDRMLECYNASDEKGARKALDAAMRFMDEHLLKWIGAYARSGAELRGAYFLYPEVIELLGYAMKADREMLDAIAAAFDERWGTCGLGNRES